MTHMTFVYVVAKSTHLLESPGTSVNETLHFKITMVGME